MNTYASLSEQERLMIRNQLISSFPLIQAVIEGVQQGQIFRNTRQDFWVVHKAGFSEVFLNTNDSNEFVDFIIHNRDLPTYFHFYNPPVNLVNLLKANTELFNIRDRDRIQLKYDEQQGKTDIIPQHPEYTITKVTSDDFESLSVFNLDLAHKFWNGKNEFIKAAFSFFVKDSGNNPVSLCYAAAIAGKKAEIDVRTSENYRGNGLAQLAVASFIIECIDNKIIPSWDCFADNTPSLRTALRLGFIENNFYKLISVYRK